MFSYYKKGFKQKKADGIITIDELRRLIVNHPNKELICQLHREKYKNDAYVKIKESLPCITPGGVFGKERKLEELVFTSEYLFFDIDNLEQNTIESYKQELIGKYRNLICMIGKSVGGRGLFFYLHVQGLTEYNYEDARNYYIEEVFTDADIDRNAKGINRPHIIPYDPNLYYNGDISLQIPDLIDIQNTRDSYKRETVAIKIKKERRYTGKVSFLPINDILSKMKWETEVDTGDDLFLLDPVDYFKLYLPREIKEGTRHKTIMTITRAILFLNPDFDLFTIQSFINHVNQNNMTPLKMEDMMRTVEFAFNRVKETGEHNIRIRTKTVHINKVLCTKGHARLRLASKLNGLLKVFKSVAKIIKAKEELKGEKKITKRMVSKLSGLTLKTVSRHWDKTLEEVYDQMYDSNLFDSGVSGSLNQDEIDNKDECLELDKRSVMRK